MIVSMRGRFVGCWWQGIPNHLRKHAQRRHFDLNEILGLRVSQKNTKATLSLHVAHDLVSIATHSEE